MQTDAKKRRLTSEWFSSLQPALRSTRMWKTFIRCWIVLTVTLVIMVCEPTATLLGPAPFFCSIVALLLPPSLAGSIFLVAVFTMLLGLLLGWAWGNAAMVAALHSRSAVLLADREHNFRSSLDPNISVDLQAQIALLHGLFLDPRSSAVYGSFFFVGTFGLGLIRAYIPNLTLLSIMATIVLDVICTIGPLFPTPQYMLAKSFILPTAIYAAVALLSLVLIFPESLNRVWLSSLLDGFLKPTLDLLRLQDEVLTTKPSDHETWAEQYARATEIRNTLLYDTNSLMSQIGLIDLDFSFGRLGPADLRRIHSELKLLLYRVGSIQCFQAFVNDRNNFDRKLEAKAHAPAQRFHIFYRHAAEREAFHGHDLDSLVPILASCSASLRSLCEDALLGLCKWVEDCNKRRWLSIFSRDDTAARDERHNKLVDDLKKLQDALEEFRSVERVKLIKPYEKLFDPDILRLKDENTFVSRSLFTSFVFIHTLDTFAEELVKFLTVIVEVDQQRTRTRFWFPGRGAKVKENLTKNEFKGSAGPLSLGAAEDLTSFDRTDSEEGDDSSSSLETTVVEHEESTPDKSTGEKETPVEKKRCANPDAFPPKTVFGKFWVKLAAFGRFFKSPQGIFALRHAVLSVALWIPSVCPSTVWFYYVYKGIWALIMGQIALALYAGDQIANFFLRICGTLAGLVIGLAVWYIGAGSGVGNPYGIVIATTVFAAPFLFVRVALPPEKMALWLMIVVTMIFVVGYSWVNSHLNSIGNVGVGVAIGWKRVLLVIIGFTAAFIMMIFPNPVSSRVLVRKTLAATLSEAGDIFATEVEAFLAEEALTRSRKEDEVTVEAKGKRNGSDLVKNTSKDDRMRRMGKRVIVIASRLRELRASLTFAQFEPQLSGTWPKEEYYALFDIHSRVVGALVLLINSFAKLDPKWCSRLVHKTPYLNPNFLSDVFMAVSVAANCLKHGVALPAHLPNLRDRLVYHAHKSLKGTSGPTPKSSDRRQLSENATEEEEGEEMAEPRAEDVHDSSTGIEADELTLDVLLDEHLPAHGTAIIALSSLISRVDEATDIVRKLCGEATFKGYDILEQAYIDQEKAVGGGVYHMTHI